MDKNRIISDISIEFGLSSVQSEKVVNSIFNSLNQLLKKNRNLEIKKFGKFKLISENETGLSNVKFTPSKKLSLRVNSNFENLKKIKMKTELPYVAEDKSENKISEHFVELVTDKIEPIVIDISEDHDEIVISEIPRKLISDDVIELHKEITKEEKSEPTKTNLWG